MVGLVHKCATELREYDTSLDCDLYPDKSVYPHIACVSSPTHVPLPPPSRPLNLSRCEPMKHEYCASLYNETVIPNLIGQYSQVVD